jgi:hypothetical protein
MVGTLIKQPNGKYCIVKYSGEIFRYNLTEQDIINMYISDAKACIGAAEHSGNLIAKTVRSEYGCRESNISNDVLRKMGFNKTYNELVKFVPRKPLYQRYVSCEFATYGECPNCGKNVRDGMGGTDEKCKCGQLLRWD